MAEPDSLAAGSCFSLIVVSLACFWRDQNLLPCMASHYLSITCHPCYLEHCWVWPWSLCSPAFTQPHGSLAVRGEQARKLLCKLASLYVLVFPWTKSQCTLPSPCECEESDPMDICYCLGRSGPRGIKWEEKCRSVEEQTSMLRENMLPFPPFYPAFGRTCFHLHPYI